LKDKHGAPAHAPASARIAAACARTHLWRRQSNGRHHAQAAAAGLDVDLPFPPLGIALVAIAFIPPVWAAGLFRREGTEINPTSPTNRALVTRGPYRFTRNPMYLGLITFALGVAVWVGAWPMFLAPIAVFATTNFVHIPFEEAKMRRQFGAA
jgi:hypothetical protein